MLNTSKVKKKKEKKMVEGEKKGLAETQWFPKAELNFIQPLD